jgi:hypothetical protein
MKKRLQGFVEVDNRGRLSVGRFTDIRRFIVEVDDEDGRVTLIPAVVVPANQFGNMKESQ